VIKTKDKTMGEVHLTQVHGFCFKSWVNWLY
jgi:hypothetical protein